jgi:flagellar biosynthesis component FlhA
MKLKPSLAQVVILMAAVGIISCVVIPVSSGLLDVLVVANIAFAILLLLHALSVGEPQKLSTLPSMLLMAALYRLVLNISSTRLILSHGEAGTTIEAFGRVVMGGSFIVGLVLFALIALVQLIVVSKGAERVAEVAARFTLDALPGKQMSIDADVRSGVLSLVEARQKREELHVESRFYGALDGAMKFVKGDAIAGLCIVLITLIAGLAIGVLEQGLSLAVALRKYALLSVGDGLASQLPALLNACAAGIVVTRVSKEGESSLARDLSAQLASARGVLIALTCGCVLLALFPAMPSLGLLSVALFFFCCCFAQTREESAARPAEPAFAPRLASALRFEVLAQADLARAQLLRELQAAVEQSRDRCFKDYGCLLPPAELNALLPTGSDNGAFELKGYVHGVLVLQQTLAAEPSSRSVAEQIYGVISAHLAEIIDERAVRRLLDLVEQELPELPASVIPEVISLSQFTALIRALIEDQLVVHDVIGILHIVAEQAAKAKSERLLLAEVREYLKRQISAGLTDGAGAAPAGNKSIAAWILDPECDLAFVQAERKGEAISEGMLQAIFASAQSADVQAAGGSQRPLLLASKYARQLVQECLRARGLCWRVLAHEELVTGLRVACLGILGSEQDVHRPEQMSLAA